MTHRAIRLLHSASDVMGCLGEIAPRATLRCDNLPPAALRLIVALQASSGGKKTVFVRMAGHAVHVYVVGMVNAAMVRVVIR
jgi:hypothetical protein